MDAPYSRDAEGYAETVAELQAACRRVRELGMHVFLGYHAFDRSTVRHALPEDGRRRVDARGERRPVPCPIGPDYWNAVFEERAVILTEALADPAYQLDGFLFDVEVYRLRGWGADCYCDDCLREFAEHAGLDVTPRGLPAAERAAWLADQGLSRDYERFQLQRVTELAAGLRERLDAMRPRDPATAGMVFGYYPENPIQTWRHALATGLSDGERPVLLMPEYTYSGFDETLHLEGRAEQLAETVGRPIALIPGFNYLRVPEPESWPSHLYAFATRADGYWLYPGAQLVEGSSLPDDVVPRAHAALRLANEEIARSVEDPEYQSELQWRPQWPHETAPAE